MKRINLIKCLIITLLSLGNTGCKKEVVETNDPPLATNEVPVANAGRDTTIYSLAGSIVSIVLDGTASWDPDNNLKSFNWKIINGGPWLSISDPDKLQAVASGLESPNIYEFELTVTDAGNLFSTDTVMVSLADTNIFYGNNEIIFKERQWIYPWYMEIEIYNILSYLPPNSHIKNVFIKRDSSTDWELAVPVDPNSPDYAIKPEWELWNGVLVVYPGKNQMEDTPDIKIVY